MHHRNESSHGPGIHPGTAWQFMGNLRRRNPCRVAVRLTQAPRDQSGRMRSAEERAVKAGNKNDRVDARKLGELLRAELQRIPSWPGVFSLHLRPYTFAQRPST